MILPRLFYPTPPFVIPSEESWAFGSSKGMKNVPYLLLCPFPNELSSRPERTRISCHAALDKTACAPFCKGKAHEVQQRHQVPQETRGSAVEGPAVNHPHHQIWMEAQPHPFSYRPKRSVVEGPRLTILSIRWSSERWSLFSTRYAMTTPARSATLDLPPLT
jgi:hypothetical protein